MTKTSKETVQQIADLLAKTDTIRTRNMMGGYLVYLDEVLIGQINNNQLHIKITPHGEKYADHLEKVAPYFGAKLAFRVPVYVLAEADWLIDFITGTRDQLKKQ